MPINIVRHGSECVDYILMCWWWPGRCRRCTDVRRMLFRNPDITFLTSACGSEQPLGLGDKCAGLRVGDDWQIGERDIHWTTAAPLVRLPCRRVNAEGN